MIATSKWRLICQFIGLVAMIVLPNLEDFTVGHRPPSLKKFDEIVIGMSDKDVIIILGPPGRRDAAFMAYTDEIVGYSNPDGSFVYLWYYEDCEIKVAFTKARVCQRKEMSPAPRLTVMEEALAFLWKHFVP
jgi:hypothetical protein